jgi:hypothetical protein
LALAILVDYFNERPLKEGWLAGQKFNTWTVKSRVWKYHQCCKRSFVAGFNHEAWELHDTQIHTWMTEQEDNE